MDISQGFDEFKWGIKSFYTGFYNKAIFSFEKAVSYNPEDQLAREWLGRAYYMSGLEDTAISVWNALIDSGYRSTNLDNKMEIISSKRRIYDIPQGSKKLIIEKEIKGGSEEEGKYFKRPGAVLPLPGGDFIVASFVTNELVVFNANGRLLSRIKGGMGIINNPFDVISATDGSLFVSEYTGNQITKLTIGGRIEKKFGKRGSGSGELLGPQYLADSKTGYIYVSDWGNKRISKYDYDGKFILSFGKSSGRYQGLKGPTGVAVIDNRVCVADLDRKSIDIFDHSGNFIKTVGRGIFHGPEGITPHGSDSLLVADTDRIVVFNIELEHAEVIFEADRQGRLAFARYNVNNDLMVSDFNKNSIMFLSDIESVYEGLFVRIDSIDEVNFPVVRLLASIEKRNGQPVIGLEKGNFRVSEDGMYPDDLSLVFQGNQSKTADISVVFEESVYMTEKKDVLRKTINELYSSFKSSDKIRLISAGRNASMIADEKTEREDVIKNILQSTSYSAEFALGAGIRLGASQIVRSMEKKAVVFLYSGKPSQFKFEQYKLVDIMQYLRNNNINFYYIYFEPGAVNEELEYLCRETGGSSYYIYEPDGIGDIADVIKDSSSSYYLLEYRSKSFEQFGRKYIPVKLETVYNKKSGRDELGYFASGQ
jgi:DNA-binding beta-propeller fold protein YncE